MWNKKKNILTLVVIVIIGFMVYDFFSVKLQELNGTGELIESFSSPNGQYVAKSFFIDDGGATVASRVRVSITSSKNNEEEDFNDETVYWGYRESDAVIKWVDDHTLIINGRKIDILNEETYYNWKDYL